MISPSPQRKVPTAGIPGSILSAWLLEAYQQREHYLQTNHIQAYRLCDRGFHDLPFVIDIYQEGTKCLLPVRASLAPSNAVIHVFEKSDPALFRTLETVLREQFQVGDFFYKDRIDTSATRVALQSATSVPSHQVALPKNKPKTIEIQEYGHTFLINLADYLDTGLFLDHRETRRWIQARSKDKIVLNTFAYTGSFSVYAAAGGATKTYSVDLSKAYCEWIKKNLELNKLAPEQNWVYKMDTFEFFNYARRKKLLFDIIVIDPPTFSRNKGQNFSVQADHPLLINEALQLLRPKGFILFSNNKVGFTLARQRLNPCEIKNFHQQSLPPDFTNPDIHQCFIIQTRA